MSDGIGKAALIGGGVIGGGWAARFALNGIDVTIFDPDPDAERKVTAVFKNAARALRKLYVAPLPPQGRLRYASSLADAVADADWVQESVPERLEIKQRVIAEVEAAARPDAIIGSSTSGFRPSQLRDGACHPERIIVAHPFVPVYLIPLVELVGGESDPPGLMERAEAALRGLGMFPLRLRKEIDAHIADRFLEAVWREALWLVKDGIATTAEIDNAIRHSFGLRWAQMGLFEGYRIAGGEAGMRHFLEQFGPCLTWPWTRLTDVPDFDDALVDLITGQSDAQSGARSIGELERIRDDNLIGFLNVLKAQPWGAGETLVAHEARLRELSFAEADESHDMSQPLTLHRAEVLPEWLDYNGHMTEFRYLHVFGDATDAFLRFIGQDSAYMARGRSVYTVETHLRHLREVRAGRPLNVETQLLGHDAKRIAIVHTMREAETGETLATAEHMLLSVDTQAGRACEMEAPLPERLATIRQGHAALPKPDFVGRAIRDLAG